MGKYERLSSDIFSIFGSSDWVNEGVRIFPQDYTKTSSEEEFLRANIVPSGKGLNRNSVAGVVIVDIFFVHGSGPKRGFQLADVLDKFLVNKSRSTIAGQTVQFTDSSVQGFGQDSQNPNLSRMQYTVLFNFFGVL